jgi:hypothetical protein
MSVDQHENLGPQGPARPARPAPVNTKRLKLITALAALAAIVMAIITVGLLEANNTSSTSGTSANSCGPVDFPVSSDPGVQAAIAGAQALNQYAPDAQMFCTGSITDSSGIILQKINHGMELAFGQGVPLGTVKVMGAALATPASHNNNAYDLMLKWAGQLPIPISFVGLPLDTALDGSMRTTRSVECSYQVPNAFNTQQSVTVGISWLSFAADGTPHPDESGAGVWRVDSITPH